MNNSDSPFTLSKVLLITSASAGVIVLLFIGIVLAINNPQNPIADTKMSTPSPESSTSPTIRNQVAQNTPTPSPEVKGSSTETITSIDIFKLYLLINAHRKDHSLSPLRIHPALEASAQFKIDDMIKRKYYRHQDEKNDPSWHFISRAGYQYQSAGENLSFGHNSAWEVFDSWIQSPSHDEQLLQPNYVDMGLAQDCNSFLEYPDAGCIVVLHLGKE